MFRDLEARKAYHRQYYLSHKEEFKASYERAVQRLKELVLSHYSSNSHPSCVMCGFTNVDALTIDHIYGGGLQHRKRLNLHGGWAFYRWLREQGYPKGYQTLCMNCQFIKMRTKVGAAEAPSN